MARRGSCLAGLGCRPQRRCPSGPVTRRWRMPQMPLSPSGCGSWKQRRPDMQRPRSAWQPPGASIYLTQVVCTPHTRTACRVCCDTVTGCPAYFRLCSRLHTLLYILLPMCRAALTWPSAACYHDFALERAGCLTPSCQYINPAALLAETLCCPYDRRQVSCLHWRKRAWQLAWVCHVSRMQCFPY